MHRFVMFVDGSNLFGAMKNMDIQIEDYEKFYRHVFDEAVKIWRGTLDSGSITPAQLHRVYWYVLGSMDNWDLTDPKAQVHLHERFEADKEVKRTYMALAGQKLSRKKKVL